MHDLLPSITLAPFLYCNCTAPSEFMHHNVMTMIILYLQQLDITASAWGVIVSRGRSVDPRN